MLRWTLFLGGLLALILVPFGLFGPELEAWSVALVAATDRDLWTGLAIAALLAVDVLLPVPSSVLSVVAGATLGVIPGALASATGMTAGCLVGYALGRRGGRPALHRLAGAEAVDRLESAGGRFGLGAVVASRAVPVLAEASTVLAGVAALPRVPFLVTVVLANLGISLVYATVGSLAMDVESFLLAFAGALGLPAVAWAMYRWRPGRAPVPDPERP